MRNLKQSTAANIMVLMTDSADHVTGKAGLTLAIAASKDGGAFGAVSPVVTERGDGWYSLALTAAMTDTLGDLAGHVTAAGADPTDFLCRVVAGSLDADISSRAVAGAAMTLTGTYDAAKTAAQAGDQMALTPETLNSIKALDQVIEGTITNIGMLRIMLAKLAGATTGAGTGNIIFKSLDGAKNRIDYTVNPQTGERSEVELDVS